MTFGIDSHRPFTTNEKGALLAGLTLVFPHVALATRTYAAGLSAMRWGFKFGVPYAFGAGFDWNRSIQPDLDFLGPGGGGPGHSLTSTNPPPAVEATGASLAQHGKTEGPARASQRGSRPRRSIRKPKRCPKGTRWGFGLDHSVGYPRFHCMLHAQWGRKR
jgi:hypothetical protein